MSIPGKPVCIRLSPHLVEKLDALHGQHYGSLPQSIVIRLIFSAVLDRPMSEQVKMIDGELRKPRFGEQAL